MQIAIVEDTPVNLVVMQSLVGRLATAEQPIDCQVFSEPEVGLAWCQANRPDLIIVDYMMPGMDGIDFIRHCRQTEHLRELPILMVTAAAEREVRYGALDAGATDFLTKPIDRNEFLPRVRNMMRLRAHMTAIGARADVLAREVRKATEEIQRRERETVVRLARAAEFRDPETGAHINRMAQYSLLIARRLGLGEDDLDSLLTAAPMHDVGKLGTPDHILLKPGRLTEDELKIMRLHPLIGYEILKDSASPMLQMAAQIALTHHEKFDGSGYPHGLSGADIPLVGRIVAVADVFDALTSARPYKPAWDIERARNYLLDNSGSHFDPACIEALLSQWSEVLGVRQHYQD
ncbi:MAG: response regulator [Moraxellaceae bacterium]|nr:response regulator [Moraxellaceae bacterium]